VLIVTDDGAGITVGSVEVWENNRGLFGTFVEARVYAYSDGAMIDGRLCRWRIDRPDAPKMVLIDDQGNELWLSGTPCGYGGQGAGGAVRILRQEGFGDVAETVYDTRLVKVVFRKGEDGAVTSQVTEKGTTPWDGTDRVDWLWRQGQSS
jgi:hypothetical protein